MNKINVVDIESPEFEKKILEIFSKNGIKNSDRFLILSDGWIRDLKTGLDWGPSSSGIMNLEKANSYCKNCAGRLPTVDELQTILDRNLSKSTCDIKIFKDVRLEWYWTSTKYIGCDDASWCVSFYDGRVNCSYEGGGSYVRPVRASQ